VTLSGNGIVQGTNRVTCNINYKTWNQFLDNANGFMNITSESILQDLSPGGCCLYYKHQFLSGASIDTVLREIMLI
jgi:hypothetical protein